MKFRTLALATAAVSLAASPAIAEAAYDRANAPVEGESELEGESGILIAILASAAIIAGIIIVADGGEDAPTSP
ncbi:hypothetical protein ACI5KX_12860 [Erythrobacter sp. GH1-10]|uniref:hypothetical protein n=1 Tax=Erythrobacter sp. GH1-10 TaxID=3349334 RepID=UPI003877F202